MKQTKTPFELHFISSIFLLTNQLFLQKYSRYSNTVFLFVLIETKIKERKYLYLKQSLICFLMILISGLLSSLSGFLIITPYRVKPYKYQMEHYPSKYTHFSKCSYYMYLLFYLLSSLPVQPNLAFPHYRCLYTVRM